MHNRFYRCAVIDIGANSVRMNIYDINTESREYSIAASARNMLGLAALVSGGKITERGTEMLMQTLAGFREKAKDYGCRRVMAFATAGLRSVSNGIAIADRIRSELGIEISVITGEKEARYDFAAMLGRFGDAIANRGVVLDMGGGSTEMIAFENKEIKALYSMKIGSLALYRNYVRQKKSPPFPTRAESWSIIRYTRMVIGSKKEFRGFGGTAYLTGGTARTIAKLHKAVFGGAGTTAGYSFPAADMPILKKSMIADMKNGGRLLSAIAGDRLNSIMPGLLAYTEIFAFLGVDTIVSCGSGVRDGFLLEFIDENFTKKSPVS